MFTTRFLSHFCLFRGASSPCLFSFKSLLAASETLGGLPKPLPKKLAYCQTQSVGAGCKAQVAHAICRNSIFLKQIAYLFFKLQIDNNSNDESNPFTSNSIYIDVLCLYQIMLLVAILHIILIYIYI